MRIIVSIITLSLVITVFLLRHISCFPQIHIVSLVLRFLSFGCDTVGRCGQNSSLMPVKDKRYLLDETPGTNLPAQPPLVGVWNLFVSNSSFIHAAYQFRSTRRLRVVVKGLCRRMKAIAGFLLAVYRLDGFKRVVYTFCPMVELVAKQSSICIWSHFWLLWRFFFVTEMSNICSLSLSSFILSAEAKFLFCPL